MHLDILHDKRKVVEVDVWGSAVRAALWLMLCSWRHGSVEGWRVEGNTYAA